ncbi:acyltransferase [Streptomyces oryzae]|uniref:Acyltransferase n=1 Tax=Streptomyces oryzae TaxID=1434886 RepID=A0ABS3XGV3_9ACTN|nr:acyltransferase [Streptomyces oryzae]MBO8194628.1 acyltransferase [Streptomyces oryzae]
MGPFLRPPPEIVTLLGRAFARLLEPEPPAHRGTRSRPARLPSLTGLRFAAAGGVVYTHSVLLLNPHLAQSLGPEVWVGGASVSLFFILSGYVLTHSARPSDTARAFWRRRAAKILPNHVVTWAVVVSVLACAGAASIRDATGITAHLSSLFLVNTWVPSPTFVSAGNPVSWSLAAEGFFYLLFPVLHPRIERLSRRGLLAAAGAAVAAVWALPAVGAAVVNPAGSFFADYWLLYMLPLSRLPEFVLGMLAARMSQEGVRLPRVGVLPAALGVVSTLLMSSSVLPDRFMFAAATALPLVLLVHAVAQLDLRGRPSLLRARPIVFLGEISYAMYLVHFLVLGLVVMALLHCGWSRPLSVLAAMPLVFAASWAQYAGVERPCMRRWSVRRAPADPESGPGPVRRKRVGSGTAEGNAPVPGVTPRKPPDSRSTTTAE